METAIKEVGITFLVGAITILGVEFSLFYMLGVNLTGFFSGRLGLEESAQTKVEASRAPMSPYVFVGLSIVLGIVVEDISYRSVEAANLPFKTAHAWLAREVPEQLRKDLGLDAPQSRDDLRISSLIPHSCHLATTGQSLTTEKAATNMPPPPCANRLAHTISEVVFKDSKNVSTWLRECSSDDGDSNTCSRVCAEVCRPDGAPFTRYETTASEIRKTVVNAYYRAKNLLFRQPQYYDELRRIEQRIGFMRSIGMALFVQYALSLALVGVSIIRAWFGKTSKSPNADASKPHEDSSLLPAQPRPSTLRALGVGMATSVLIGGIAMATYEYGLGSPLGMFGFAVLVLCLGALGLKRLWRRKVGAPHFGWVDLAKVVLIAFFFCIGAALLAIVVAETSGNISWDVTKWRPGSIALLLVSANAIAIVIGVIGHNAMDVAELHWFGDTIERIGRQVLLSFGVCTTLFVLNVFAFWAYARESDEFTKRVFGYHFSMILDPTK